MNLIRRLIHEEEGAALVEYALLVALIAVVAMGAVAMTGTSINARFTDVANALNP